MSNNTTTDDTTVQQSSEDRKPHLTNEGLTKVNNRIEELKANLEGNSHARHRANQIEREIVKAMLETAATHEDIADYLDISTNALRNRYGELLRRAKRDRCTAIVGQLANMAQGFRVVVDPNTGELVKEIIDAKVQISAAQFWAARVAKLIEKQEHEVTGRDGSPIISSTLQGMDDSQVSAVLAALAAGQILRTTGEEQAPKQSDTS